MAKVKKAFFCKNCGFESAKWLGKCPACNEWNTFVEEVIQTESSVPEFKRAGMKSREQQPMLINDIAPIDMKRWNSNNGELDRVLGGGVVPGSIVLIGGEPGVGKSTLMLQVALKMKNCKILYVSGEESEQQVKMRADRIGIENSDCFILTETSLDNIFVQIKNIDPDLLVIDSIQTLNSSLIESAAGSISQVRECAGQLQKFAKMTSIPVFLIGHITKDGSIAGPKILEHVVDTVLQFEGDKSYGYRILRSIKNRFGSTSELGIYEMNEQGLKEVLNPSEMLISQHEEDYSGIAIAASIEGVRPMLVEIQALVSTAAYGTPQRSTTGFDQRRLNMLLAVLEKRAGFRLGSKDVFLNITGGIRLDDPALDLAVISAILSSNEDISVDRKICFAAEVGLSGEIRPVMKVENRIAEAQRLGFDHIVISKSSGKGLKKEFKGINIVAISKIEELCGFLFG